MATHEELVQLRDTLRAKNINAVVAPGANYFANSLESMAQAARRGRGPRPDALILQCADHSVLATLVVVRTDYLRELLARVEAADKVLARDGADNDLLKKLRELPPKKGPCAEIP